MGAGPWTAAFLNQLDAPHRQAIEVAHVTGPRGPLSAAQIKVDLDDIAYRKAADVIAVIACELKADVLRVASVRFEHEYKFALAKAVCDLLGFADNVDGAFRLICHFAVIRCGELIALLPKLGCAGDDAERAERGYCGRQQL